MNIYLKIFLTAGIPFGIFAGIFYSIQYGISQGILLGLFSVLFFGGFMSLILGFLNNKSLKNMPYEISEKTTGVRHIRNIELRIPYDEAFNLCIKSCDLIKGCKIRNFDLATGIIVTKTGISFKCWGEVITFDLRKINDEKTQIVVLSKPVISTTLVDFGKNIDNVEKITTFLNDHNQTINEKS